MDLRALNNLQKALPIVLRHLGGYVELAVQDLEAAKAAAVVRLRATAVIALAGFLCVLMLCALVIALTWDTEYRVLAIGLLAAAFAIPTAVAGFLLARRSTEPFAAVRREWQQDRVLIDRWLTQGD